MKEELIVSGRMNQLIDPHLHIWPLGRFLLYLSLGGMAAGILAIAALYYIRGREKDYRTAVRITPFLAPVLLVIGLVALFIDLRHKLFFWQLYTNIKTAVTNVLGSMDSYGNYPLYHLFGVHCILKIFFLNGIGNMNGYMK